MQTLPDFSSGLVEASPNLPLLMTEVELNIQPSLGGFGESPASEHCAIMLAKWQEALASTTGTEHAVPCALCVNPHFWRQCEFGLGVTGASPCTHK